LVSVADLGGDDDDDFDPPVEEPQAAQPPKVVAQSKPTAVIEADVEPEVENEADFAAADADVENPFVAMQLSPEVLEAIGKAGYDKPSPIQLQTVPHLMDGRDLIGQAETGSGKTAAFAWPLLSRLDLSQKAPQVIVLAPTRELAVQVTTAFKKYASCTPGFRTTTIYGGQSYETQFRALDRGAIAEPMWWLVPLAA